MAIWLGMAAAAAAAVVVEKGEQPELRYPKKKGTGSPTHETQQSRHENSRHENQNTAEARETTEDKQTTHTTKR